VFTTILIANRGEIACRIAATARRMGIRTVAVYSDADAQAKHVAACDTAIYLGGSEPKDSYLRADLILEAAKKTGAQAIHPGYGFLAENDTFARACAQAGITFIGPNADAIAAMGSKSAAKTLMDKAGVPLVPGYHGENQEAAFLKQQADTIGYPVLIKASAGGGGKGMRIVNSAAEFDEALSSCQREAKSSFGDDTVLIERYIQKPRHIEIQIFADQQGNTVYLFERDCSIQRRYQKVIEEAPAPGLTAERRQAMGEAAVAAARAVNYVGAGTVEFIAEPDGRFYFMEMNTRLQVEHPVTELITGLDLVQWQLQVAAGQPLPLTQDQLQFSGHAMEVRIYAENPDNDFLPSIGTLSLLQFPNHVEFSNGDVRVDGGVSQGDTISPYYDPMIAKLIVKGDNREQARLRLAHALAQIHSLGVATNIDFLQRLILDESFADADLDTGLIERRHDVLFAPKPPASLAIKALAVAAVLGKQGQTQHHLHQPPAADPWDTPNAWRISGHYQQTITLNEGGQQHLVTVEKHPQGWTLTDDTRTVSFEWHTQLQQNGSTAVNSRCDGHANQGYAGWQGDHLTLFTQGQTYRFETVDPDRYGESDADQATGGLIAPMPGKIIAINVAPGDTVKQGDKLLVMEAMKMEHTIHAPTDGVVEELFYDVGDQVSDGAELISITD